MDFLSKAANAALSAAAQGTEQPQQTQSSTGAASTYGQQQQQQQTQSSAGAASTYGQQQQQKPTQTQSSYGASSEYDEQQERPQQTQTQSSSTGIASGFGLFQQKPQQTEQSQQQQTQQTQQAEQQSTGGILGNVLNNALGGGAKGEKQEDLLDKGIDMVQEKIFKQGDQSNESATEQAKDKMIADVIRNGYKNAVGKDFPIAEKEKEKESSGLSSLAGAASGFFGKK